MTIARHIKKLLDKGVIIPEPLTVEIDRNIDPAAIASGVIIHSGSRLLGDETSIGPDSIIGEEGPATVINCQLARSVRLKGGYFERAVFLSGSSMGLGAHVRSGTLLEEQASGAHTVGLKQTVFLPYVTAGSLINFCDTLMAGGTSRKNHSEIGSSYIHFNYTPHGDKATASLLGDVPRGVMLNNDPIFLGGQGGLVGPVRMEYGCVTAAGVIYRRDSLEPNMLLTARQRSAGKPIPYKPSAYRGVQRIIQNNLIYIGNLWALSSWYKYIRRPFMDSDPYDKACLKGALSVLQNGRQERIKRLDDLAEKLSSSIDLLQDKDPGGELRVQQQFVKRWPDTAPRLALGLSDDSSVHAARNKFLEAWNSRVRSKDYLSAIQRLNDEERSLGTAWLQAVVDAVSGMYRMEQ